MNWAVPAGGLFRGDLGLFDDAGAVGPEFLGFVVDLFGMEAFLAEKATDY